MKQTKVEDIKHENGDFWVLDMGDSYAVLKIGVSYSTSNSFYPHNEDGLSIAMAYCDYLAQKQKRRRV